jgi:hypothetical protein
LPFVFIIFIALVGSVATNAFAKTLVSWLTVAAQYGINGLMNGRNCYQQINGSGIPKN